MAERPERLRCDGSAASAVKPLRADAPPAAITLRLPEPSRIVCLTEETTETLYLLGEGDRVVGVSGYTVRPAEARRKPKVSAYISARYDHIEALRPDLVLAFSDLQAEIVAELVRRGLTVVCFNQRSVAEILAMIECLGRLIGVAERARELADRLRDELADLARRAALLPTRPLVFVEEWCDPLISGIRWVAELVELAGGRDPFPELRQRPDARSRIVEPAMVVDRNPDLIVASWCGRKVKKAAIAARPGWDQVAAVENGRIVEIKSSILLQPGPAALTDGATALEAAIRETALAMSGARSRTR
jgi:iron complex transport system substrate-binding protein